MQRLAKMPPVKVDWPPSTREPHMRSILIFAILALFTPARAHIPKLNTILSKVAGNTGGSKGLIIKRTLTLKDDNITANETWYIANADLMKVEVSGTNADDSKWSFEILYKDGKRFTSTIEGGVKSFPQSPEFFEPLLHYRSSRALLSKLISMQIVPPNAANAVNQDHFVSLDRLKGSVVYVFGASESKSAQPPPQLWLEQDSFVIKKIRMGSQVEAEFDSYKDYEDGKIKQAENQKIFWNNITLTLQNTSLQLTSPGKLSSQFKMQKVDAAKLPDNEKLKEFYSRFR